VSIVYFCSFEYVIFFVSLDKLIVAIPTGFKIDSDKSLTYRFRVSSFFLRSIFWYHLSVFLCSLINCFTSFNSDSIFYIETLISNNFEESLFHINKTLINIMSDSDSTKCNSPKSSRRACPFCPQDFNNQKYMFAHARIHH
jgi:hypothetical protein